MSSDVSTTIKDKFPEGYDGALSRPLFYCDLDDTLHLSRSDASFHYHKCLIDKADRSITDTRRVIEDKLEQLQVMKRNSLPYYQRTINDIKARLRELLSNKDWKSTHATHAEKRREVLELRYRLMFVVGEYKKQILKFNYVRREYRQAKESIATLEKERDEAKQKAKEAEEYWKEHKDDKE